MRKERKQNKVVAVATMQGYHETSSYITNYAFQGFNQNKYFTSDRVVKLDNNFNAPGVTLKGYGLEIETECFGGLKNNVLVEVIEKVIASHFPCDLFKYQRDGSLRGGTSQVEIITQVMTKSFIRNNYQNFKLMYDTYFAAFDISASRSGNCGMHTNISIALFGSTKEKQYDNIKKLYYIINNYYNEFCYLLNRDISNTFYCRKMNTSNLTITNPLEYAKQLDLENMSNSHGVCLNLGHVLEGRVEIRLPGGQKNFPAFRNTLEVIFHVIDNIKYIKWADLTKITNIFKGCNQYVLDRIKSHLLNNNLITIEEYEELKTNSVREELL